MRRTLLVRGLDRSGASFTAHAASSGRRPARALRLRCAWLEVWMHTFRLRAYLSGEEVSPSTATPFA